MRTRANITRTTLIRRLGTRCLYWRLVVFQTDIDHSTERGADIRIPALKVLSPSTGVYCPNPSFVFCLYSHTMSRLAEIGVVSLLALWCVSVVNSRYC